MSSESTTSAPKPILLLDFDGVVHSYTSGWTTATEIRDHITEGFLDWAVEANRYFDLQIYSSRSSAPGGVDAMAAWLQTEVMLWSSQTGRKPAFEFSFPTTKPPAFLTIDDRCVTFRGKWSDIPAESLLAFRPWNREE